MELSKVINDLEIKDYSKVTEDRVDKAIRDLEDMLISKPDFDQNDVRSLAKMLDCAKEGKFRELLRWKDDGYQEFVYLMNFKQPPASAGSNKSNPGQGPTQQRNGSRGSNRQELTYQNYDTARGLSSRQANQAHYYEDDRRSQASQQIYRVDKSPLMVEFTPEKTESSNLAKYYSDLYNNEWQDAMQAMIAYSRDEEGNVKMLSKILIAAYDFCQHTADEHRHTVYQALLYPLGKSVEVPISNDIQMTVYKKTKQVQNETGYCSIPAVRQTFMENQLSKIHIKLPQDPAVKRYAEKCAEICWLLNIHDPPLAILEEKENNPIQGHLKLYTKQGNKVLYNVWPTLLLKEKGPVLTKGIVQAY